MGRMKLVSWLTLAHALTNRLLSCQSPWPICFLMSGMICVSRKLGAFIARLTY